MDTAQAVETLQQIVVRGPFRVPPGRSFPWQAQQHASHALHTGTSNLDDHKAQVTNRTSPTSKLGTGKHTLLCFGLNPSRRREQVGMRKRTKETWIWIGAVVVMAVVAVGLAITGWHTMQSDTETVCIGKLGDDEDCFPVEQEDSWHRNKSRTFRDAFTDSAVSRVGIDGNNGINTLFMECRDGTDGRVGVVFNGAAFKVLPRIEDPAPVVDVEWRYNGGGLKSQQWTVSGASGNLWELSPTGEDADDFAKVVLTAESVAVRAFTSDGRFSSVFDLEFAWAELGRANGVFNHLSRCAGL